MARHEPVDIPTRGSVEKLFREIRDHHGYGVRYEDSKHRKLEKELDELRDRLLSDRRYAALEKKFEASKAEYYSHDNKVRNELFRVRTLYLSKGLTPAVRKEIDKLVKLANARR